MTRVLADIGYLASIVLFFLGCGWFARLCERLK